MDEVEVDDDKEVQDRPLFRLAILACRLVLIDDKDEVKVDSELVSFDEHVPTVALVMVAPREAISDAYFTLEAIVVKLVTKITNSAHV